jgi:hypothetical protein
MLKMIKFNSLFFVCSLSLSLLSFCVSSVTTSTPPICSCRGFSDESIWCAPLCRKSKEHPSNRLSHNICRFYFAPRRRELVCEESNSKLARDCPGGVLQQLRLPARSLAVSRWATRIFFAIVVRIHCPGARWNGPWSFGVRTKPLLVAEFEYRGNLTSSAAEFN